MKNIGIFLCTNRRRKIPVLFNFGKFSEYFLKKGKLTGKARKERERRMSRELLEEFHKAKRESQKLSLALQILKPETDLEGAERKELLKYLDYRRRSAAMELIRAGDLAGLRAMELRGWLEQQHLEGYRREAGRLGEAEIWAYLCQLSDPTCRKQEGRAARGKTAIQLETDRKAQQDEAELCGRIWKLTVKKLRMKLPGLSEALSILRFECDEKIRGLAGDGFQVFYRSGELFPAYVDSPELVARNLLHLIIHNLYLHPLLSAGKDERLWNLACDMTAERLLDGWKIRGLSRPGNEYRALLLKEQQLPEQWQSAGVLYQILSKKSRDPGALEKLEEEFRIDDHRLWRQYRRTERPEDQPEGEGCEGTAESRRRISRSGQFLRTWNRIRREWSPRMDDRRQKAGTSAGRGVQEVILRKRKEYDYRHFLEDFMVCQEEVELDLDSFDFLPYWYSRTHYQGIILLEPLEYREVHKLDEMVIAIDTSGSCSGHVVRRFLEETYQILTARGNFFRKMKVHILQCDSMIQEHVVIRSREEFLDYMDQVTVKGLGGTDFRPVFRLVDRLIEEKEIHNLKGLLYFTDGDGIYPKDKPSYETAFIFLNREYEKHEVPEWGLRLNLGLKLEED